MPAGNDQHPCAMKRKEEKITMDYKSIIGDVKYRYSIDEKLESVRQEYNKNAKTYCDTAEPARTALSEDPFLVTVIEYDRDDAWGCTPFSVLVSREYAKKAEDTMTEAITEYYENTDFHDEVTGLEPEDLVRIFLAEANFPVMRYFIENNCAARCRDFKQCAPEASRIEGEKSSST